MAEESFLRLGKGHGGVVMMIWGFALCVLGGGEVGGMGIWLEVKGGREGRELDACMDGFFSISII